MSHHAGKLLADLDADVRKVEPPRGDPLRGQVQVNATASVGVIHQATLQAFVEPIPVTDPEDRDPSLTGTGFEEMVREAVEVFASRLPANVKAAVSA